MLRLFLRTIPKRLPVKITPVTTWKVSLYTKTLDTEIRKQPDRFMITELQQQDESEYPPKDPSDIFGTYEGSDNTAENEELEEDNVDEEKRIFQPKTRRLSIQGYSILIKAHLDAKEVKEAIDILEVRMKEDRVKPTNYIYNILINGCSKAGYSKKAFQLYNKMKQRDLKVTGATYTSLFNACAMGPWPEDGLNKANRLRQIMAEKGYEPNPFNYNAMIKAYGRCGDIKTAFELGDEMLQKKLPIKTETFNFLLQSCASDFEFGFRHALLTWHKMLRYRKDPDEFSFRLLLRCVRDCSIGDVETMKQVIATIIQDQLPPPQEEPKLIEDKSAIFLEQNNLRSSNNPFGNREGKKELKPVKQHFIGTPNLLQPNPHLGDLVEISEIVKPEDRLLLLGGFTGFMEVMKHFNVTPGIETFTSILEVIPSTNSAEKQLIGLVRKIGLKADIDFFNILIKKRAMRFDYEAAKEVLEMINIAKLQPDIVTYGVLSLTCATQLEARELLSEMRSKGIRINMAILGAMLRQGCAKKNFAYIHEILQIALEEKVKPNEVFLKHLDNFVKGCKAAINDKHPITKEKHFKHNLENLERKLVDWYEEYGLEGMHLEDKIKKIKGRPFEQFKTPKEEGYERRKNEKLLQKQKARKYIKKIKLDALRGDREKSVIEGSKKLTIS